MGRQIIVIFMGIVSNYVEL